MTQRRSVLLAGLGLSPAAWTAPAPVVAELWDARFVRPEGGELALSNFRGRWLLINFWATWCAPCIKELPDLNAFAQAQTSRGAGAWQVIGLAVDGPTPVRQFLTRFKPSLTFPMGLAGLNGAEWARKLGNSGGGLPFTVAINPQGQLVWHKRGETTRRELDALVLSLA